jgi:hypothetical protein
MPVFSKESTDFLVRSFESWKHIRRERIRTIGHSASQFGRVRLDKTTTAVGSQETVVAVVVDSEGTRTDSCTSLDFWPIQAATEEA